jgi:stearoyl-CoA desaturase (delta-9 desaturase)
MASCRQGFFWWEIDMSYYVVKMLGWFGVVWDIREPPARVYAPQPAGVPVPAAAAATAAEEAAA